MKSIYLPTAALLLAVTACREAEAPQQWDGKVPDYVAAAVADKGREGQRGDDARRHPAEIIAFSSAKPGDKVLELIPGTGYWTRVLSKVVGPSGHVYAVWPQQYARYSVGNVQSLQAMAKTPD